MRRSPKARAVWLAVKRKSRDDKTAKEEPAKKPSGGGLFGKLRPGGGEQAKQSQTVASAGARGVNPDRDASAARTRSVVPVKIGQADIAEFQKGIA